MLLKFKCRGQTSSTAGNEVKRGFKGRLELYAQRGGEQGRYDLRMLDYGNFGKVRHEAAFVGLAESDLRDMIYELRLLLDGDVATTRTSEEIRDALIRDVQDEFKPPKPARKPVKSQHRESQDPSEPVVVNTDNVPVQCIEDESFVTETDSLIVNGYLSSAH